MNLHRLDDGGNDWDAVPPEERSPLQRLAAKTHGVLTPGNGVTISGGVVSELGLSEIRNHRTLRGMAFYVGGRACDLADGITADKTNTKSKVGRILDPAIDKLVAWRTCRTLMKEDILPASVGYGFLVQNGINVGATLLATLRGKDINPGPAGKYTAFLQATTSAAFCFERAIEEAEQGQVLYELKGIQEAVHKTGKVLAMASHVMGAVASTEYVTIALSAQE